MLQKRKLKQWKLRPMPKYTGSKWQCWDLNLPLSVAEIDINIPTPISSSPGHTDSYCPASCSKASPCNWVLASGMWVKVMYTVSMPGPLKPPFKLFYQLDVSTVWWKWQSLINLHPWLTAWSRALPASPPALCWFVLETCFQITSDVTGTNTGSNSKVFCLCCYLMLA